MRARGASANTMRCAKTKCIYIFHTRKKQKHTLITRTKINIPRCYWDPDAIGTWMLLGPGCYWDLDAIGTWIAIGTMIAIGIWLDAIGTMIPIGTTMIQNLYLKYIQI